MTKPIPITLTIRGMTRAEFIRALSSELPAEEPERESAAPKAASAPKQAAR